MTLPAFDMRVISPHRLHTESTVVSFVGTAHTGEFGVLSGHLPLATFLTAGWVKYRVQNQTAWKFLALPEGLLHFRANHMSIITPRFVEGDSLESLMQTLHNDQLIQKKSEATWNQHLQWLERALTFHTWKAHQ